MLISMRLKKIALTAGGRAFVVDSFAARLRCFFARAKTIEAWFICDQDDGGQIYSVEGEGFLCVDAAGRARWI